MIWSVLALFYIVLKFPRYTTCVDYNSGCNKFPIIYYILLLKPKDLRWNVSVGLMDSVDVLLYLKGYLF